MTTLITNIEQLVNTREHCPILRGKELSNLPCIQNAYLLIEDGEITGYGNMYELEINMPQLPKNIIDASGSFVLPAWCDSHTHLVYGSAREEEFVDKIKGLSYAEIAVRGGGILSSAKKIEELSEDALFNVSWKRMEEVSKLGTGAIEIKSGYGLTVEGELKMLRVIQKLKQRSSLQIRSTFLGAHTYPFEFIENHQGYIDLIVNEMLPVIAAEELADYIDVFCETDFFSPAETETICKAGMAYGLKPKLHVNQLSSIGAIEMGIKLNSLSLDHLEILTEEEIQLLSDTTWKGICTLLPTAAFFYGWLFSRQEN